MLKRFLIYGYPFYLISIEQLLRLALRLESQTFVGPTLAAIGVSFMLPLIVPKKRTFGFSKTILKKLDEINGVVITRRESIFIDVIWIFILILTVLWAYSLYLSWHKPAGPPTQLPPYLIIGFINYFAGVIAAEIKERI